MFGRSKKDLERRVEELEARLEERERSAKLVATLDEAARAMGDCMTKDAIFDAVGQTLRPLGVTAHFLMLDGDELTVDYIGSMPELLKRAEELAGISRRDYRLPLAQSPFHAEIVRTGRVTFSGDVVAVVRAGIPSRLAPVAPLIARALRMKQMIGAPLEVDSIRGLVVLSSEQLTPRDEAAVSVLAHHVSAALRKVDLITQLRTSLDDLETAQTQLVQSQKMEALGQLAGGVAHDLNNILTGVAVAADSLQKMVPEAGRADLMTIVDGVTRAATLVRQLLAFSRQQRLAREEGTLNEVVVAMVPLLERLLGEEMELHCELVEEPWFTLCDPRQIEQVLLNLVVNARDASSRGGSIRLRTLNLSVDEGEGLSPQALAVPRVAIEVEDEGEGMNEAVRQRAFDPFFTTKDPGRGTGLGLSVSYGIIHQHDGWMTLRSEPGQGTTFTIHLPRIDAPSAQEVPAPRPAAPSLTELRVLLVEDDPGVLQAASRLLRREGLEILEARSVGEARSTFEGAEIDLVVTDVVLPDGSGPTLVQELRRLRPSLRVVVMTGYADERAHRVLAAVRAQSETRVPLVAKPFTPAQLLAAMAEASLPSD